MADLVVRRGSGNGGEIQPRPTEEVVSPRPFRMMRDLLRWDPFRDLAPFFTIPLPSAEFFTRDLSQFIPAFEVKETNDAFVFKADVPGVKESDLNVELVGDRLTVKGKRDEEKVEQSDNFYSNERTYGSFIRSFTLPEGFDPKQVTANLSAGVLTVAVAKSPEIKPQRIQIKV